MYIEQPAENAEAMPEGFALSFPGLESKIESHGLHSSKCAANNSNFVLGNAQAPGWPIVYCSDGFCELTGFSRAHVMAKGSGCKFLYGPDTAEEETSKIVAAIKEKRELKTELKLYRKNGEFTWRSQTFWYSSC
ncbi:potassium voltage-gated channel subfamily h member 8 [Plakobranchus ocellatus]|uniref:Potassium voltage-gated channel subfamily h member 8 n=1 Tax=Plakobranchus ocellatus TaxID=259542 RepID=A0AAV4D0P8_9GAST|nr:potassium voltage-gated channel subfamily h member 8 [Plakobranchus ocellatus]